MDWLSLELAMLAFEFCFWLVLQTYAVAFGSSGGAQL